MSGTTAGHDTAPTTEDHSVLAEEEEVLVAALHPIRESLVSLPGGRSLGYAEFGDADGDVVLWFHGTPGARKQLPPDAPALAEKMGFRIIGVERPGTGYSTPYYYGQVIDWVDDLRRFVDALGVDRFGVVGLSGGGPYVLAAAYGMPDRVTGAAVLGGIGPTRGPEAAPGYTRLLPLIEPLIAAARVPLGEVLTHLIRPVRDFGDQAYALYSKVAPVSDRPVMRRPEMKAMFLADLLTAVEGGLRAPVTDLLVFGREWGFSIADITVPVKFWHGDADGIVPLAHGEFQRSLLPGSELVVTPGGGHFAGFIVGEDVLTFIDESWSDRPGRPAKRRAPAKSAAAKRSTAKRSTAKPSTTKTSPARTTTAKRTPKG